MAKIRTLIFTEHYEAEAKIPFAISLGLFLLGIAAFYIQM